MIRSFLFTITLIFVSAQAFAGPCGIMCDLSKLSDSSAAVAKKAPAKKSCHSTGSEDKQSSSDSQDSTCPLQVCAESSIDTFESDVLVSVDKTNVVFSYINEVVEVEFSQTQLTHFIVSTGKPLTLNNPLYILYKNLKLPS